MKISIAVVDDESVQSKLLYQKVLNMPFSSHVFVHETIAFQMHDGRADYHVVLSGGKITRNFYKELEESLDQTFKDNVYRKAMTDLGCDSVAVPTRDVERATDRYSKGTTLQKLRNYYRDRFDKVYQSDIVKGV